ncbi:ATPase component of general energizing module of ECF transporters [Methanosarcina siciliae C2J]|uniref:ATPase component of general energizing module of ECF transporters n=1 Tax=Methanosarcina siciliae C2J TaxID=1434118 RepID=A0A0E3PKW0_9EURY|nr:energy-coupling factor transporter ATPase [Methanosarcina siciliae]AKB35392.1 ATPase component of general energizing module of ECF transporters [Methanosarcina siciliae C2J]
MIEIKDLWYTYPGRTEPTLKGVNLKIKEGEFVLLTGPTGCGKSTLLKTLNGIIPHESGGIFSGSIRVNGIETRNSNQMELSRAVGLVFQNPDDQIFSTSVEDEVAFGPENLCLKREEIDKKVEEALRVVGMAGHRLASTNALSGGQKQRICIASMLAMMPEILAMDEPVSQMDPLGTREVLNTVRELNRKLKITILLVEHRIHELMPFADRIVIMDGGKIILDQPASKAFDYLEVFHRLGLRVPEPVELCHTLGIKASPLSTGEALAVLGAGNCKEKAKTPRTFSNPEEETGVQTGSAGNNGSIVGTTGNNDSIISIRDLWSGYEKNRMVLKGINLEIRKGERVAIMGTNGSGKSTLLLNLAAMLKPYKGGVKVFGEDTRPRNSYSFAGRVGFVFQNPDLMLFCDSVEEEASFGPVQLKYKDIEERTRTSLEAMSILDLKQDLPQSLSRGQRLRTAVASVLSINPEIILLDEPTTGQDRVNIEHMMNYFKDNCSTLVFCTHDIEIALLYATRILVMDEGRIIADGKGREVIKNIEILKQASLTQPPVVEIANYLGVDAFSVTELVEVLTRRSSEVKKYEVRKDELENYEGVNSEGMNSEGMNSEGIKCCPVEILE